MSEENLSSFLMEIKKFPDGLYLRIQDFQLQLYSELDVLESSDNPEYKKYVKRYVRDLIKRLGDFGKE